jgi:cation:H+ antiporter
MEVIPVVWVEFVICAALILFSGSRLSQYGDMLAEKTGMGRTWIGIILLATVTSLPELATGLSAVTIAAVPDIAVGDVVGSCVFNLMLIGLIDLFYRPGPLLSQVEQGNILSAGFGILLIGIVSWGLLLDTHLVIPWDLWIGPYTPLLLIVYGIAVYRVFHFERNRMAAFVRAEAQALKYKDVPKKTIYQNVMLHSGVVIGAGIWLPFIGSRIAEVTGWGTTFVGNLFVAASTSLPEIVTSFAAVRLAALDLAIANLFGSNLFNMAILAIDDLAYGKGPLLSDVSFYHLFSTTTALIMTGIGITGLIYRARKKAWAILSWDGAALVILYLINAYLLFIGAMER